MDFLMQYNAKQLHVQCPQSMHNFFRLKPVIDIDKLNQQIKCLCLNSGKTLAVSIGILFYTLAENPSSGGSTNSIYVWLRSRFQAAGSSRTPSSLPT